MSSNDFVAEFLLYVQSAQSEIVIVSPYITLPSVEKFLEHVPEENIKITVVTLPPGIEYLSGSIDPEALKKLQENNVTLKYVKQLHAKLYSIDQKHVFYGSANFTANGWNHGGKGNIELMKYEEISKDTWKVLYNTYIADSQPLSLMIEDFNDLLLLKGDYQKQISNLDNKFRVLEIFNLEQQESLYTHYLDRLKDTSLIHTYSKEPLGFGKHAFKINDKYTIKLMNSKTSIKKSTRAKTHEFDFSKSITEETIKRNIKAFVFLLKDTDDFLWIPRNYMTETVLKPQYLDSTRTYWRLYIVEENGKYFLTTKGKSKKKKVDVTIYLNKMTNRLQKNAALKIKQS